MIVIDDTIVSEDLIKVRFACDLSKCLGACCVEGDAGAPLDEEEIGIIEDLYEKVKPYMTPEGIEVVEDFGVFDYDADGNFVTPLINDRDCVFLYFEGNIAKCAIEKAYLEKKIKYRKPISCHLYPVRITSYPEYDAVNYHKWEICNSACSNGQRLQLPLYQYLEEPLTRAYGREWFKKLENYARENQK